MILGISTALLRVFLLKLGKVSLMRKITALLIVASASMFSLSGCALYTEPDMIGAPDASIAVEDYGELEEAVYQLPDERMVECFQDRASSKFRTLTCNLMDPKIVPEEFTQAVDTFQLAYLHNSRGEAFVCLNHGITSDTPMVLACFPADDRGW